MGGLGNLKELVVGLVIIALFIVFGMGWSTKDPNGFQAAMDDAGFVCAYSSGQQK